MAILLNFSFLLKNSEFTNISIESTWNGQFERISSAIVLEAISEQITCKNNKFNNISIKGFKIGIDSKYDIINNLFKDCNFESLQTAIQFGLATNLTDSGQQFGPRNNIIANSKFNRIRNQGIKVYNGTGNVSSQNNFTLVGNQFSGNDDATFGNIEFDTLGNISVQDYSDRHQLSSPASISRKIRTQAVSRPVATNCKNNCINEKF